MRPTGKQRLAQRHDVDLTPIEWKVARSGRRRLTLQQAAIVELSIVGAGIVAPDRFETPVGARIEIFWEDMSAWVLVRHLTPLVSTSNENLRIHGVEYLDARNQLGPALYERLVVEPAGRKAAREAAARAEARALPDPVVWGAPVQWGPAAHPLQGPDRRLPIDT